MVQGKFFGSPHLVAPVATKICGTFLAFMYFWIAKFGDPEIHECQEGAADLRRDRRHQMGRPEELPLDHGLPAELPERRAHLRQVHPAASSLRQDRGPVPDRKSTRL